MITIQNIINGNKFRLHLIFCFIIIVLLSLGTWFLHSSGFKLKSPASLFTDWSIFLICIYSGRWLCQYWYLRNKFLLFILYSVLTVITIAVLKWLIVKYAFFHPYAGFLESTRDTMPFFLTGLVLGMLLKLIRASMQKELLDAQIRTEQKAMEFNLLQLQLSPHFLFNVLNNLYGISIHEPERIPALLLKLSGLLRYTVYGAKKTFVPLKEELEYIRSYVEFEQIRISDRLNLIMDIEDVNRGDIKIAPQVLIIFIENAFKHSKNSFDKKIDIHISLKLTDNDICLEVSNSCRNERNDEILAEHSGLGLSNTIRRLNLIYGDDYSLSQQSKDGLYKVDLRIKIIKYDELPDRR